MTWKAVLFDLDGTLLDTLEDLADSMNAALESLGFPPHPVDSYRYTVGDGLDTLARRVLPGESIDPDILTACMTRMRSEYARRWHDKTEPYDGISDLLDGLSARKIRMAILSNKPDDFTQPMVEKFLRRWRFDEVRGVSEETPKKPHPEGALQIARKMELEPSEFIYIGDTNTDMETAGAAGMYPIGVLWGFRDEQELRESGAKTVIRRPTDLLDLLDRG